MVPIAGVDGDLVVAEKGIASVRWRRILCSMTRNRPFVGGVGVESQAGGPRRWSIIKREQDWDRRRTANFT